MPLALRNLARVAAAAVGLAQGVTVETDSPEVAAKSVAGVPIFNYDKAYTGKTESRSVLSKGESFDPSTHEESWIVVLKPESEGEKIHKACLQTRHGCTQEGQHPRFPFVAMRGTEEELVAFVEPIRDLARYIELDMVISVPKPSLQSKEEAAPLWGLDRIGAYKRTGAGAGVHVYVADTGVRADHVEFGGRAIPFADMFTIDGKVRCSETTAEVCGGDYDGHGTHCAGTIAGATYGVAPSAMIHSVKVLSDQGSGTTAGVVNGMMIVALHSQRPAVLSMSLGGAKNHAEEGAIDFLVDDGVVVVVAAGNEYTDACSKSPAFVPSAIAVGSTMSGDARSGFSNFGTCVAIWAPGSDILSADGYAPDQNPNNGSVSLSGTSMACPHVSGAAALLLGNDNTMKPAAVRAKLMADASVNYITDLGPLDTNSFLYVGNDGPQPAQPAVPTDGWPSESFFESCSVKGQSGPLGDFPVCRCTNRADRVENGTYCYDGDKLGCPIGEGLAELDNSPGYENVNLTWWYFLTTCTTCYCLEGPPTPEPEPPFWTAAALERLNIAAAVALVVLAGGAFYFIGNMAQPMKSKGGDVEIASA